MAADGGVGEVSGEVVFAAGEASFGGGASVVAVFPGGGAVGVGLGVFSSFGWFDGDGFLAADGG